MGRLSNISLRSFRDFLASNGLSLVRISSGHEIWSKPGLLRPVIIQTHIDPVPEFIVLNSLRTMGLKRRDIEEFLQ